MQDTNKLEELPQMPKQESACVPVNNRLALLKLLDEWMRGDVEEQRETFEVLRHSLDESRSEGYKLFS